MGESHPFGRLHDVIDPSWLLAAVMQSTAALVAIVGGLVVSRLLSLAAERSTLERQIAMLNGRMNQASREAERLRSEMVAADAAKAIDDWLDALLKSGKPDLPNEELLEVRNPGGWLVEDYEPHITALKREFRSVVEEIIRLHNEDRFTDLEDTDLPADCDDLRQFGVDVPSEPEHKDIWDTVLTEWRNGEIAERRKSRPRNPLGGVFDMPHYDLSAITLPDDVRRSAALHRRNEDEREYLARVAEADALDSEIEVLRASLVEATDPRRLWQGFAILVVFALLGIVYPMTLMAVGDQGTAAQSRWLVVAAFSIGLAGLFWYIALFVRDLRRRRQT